MDWDLLFSMIQLKQSVEVLYTERELRIWSPKIQDPSSFNMFSPVKKQQIAFVLTNKENPVYLKKDYNYVLLNTMISAMSH